MGPLNKHRNLGELEYEQVDYNWDTIEGAVNTLEFQVPPNNWSATTNPTTADNAGQGWRNGSKWYNRSAGRYFICVDATAGTWVEDTAIDVSSLGTAAYADVNTSGTDSTPGRLMQVGSFGLGRNLAAVVPNPNAASLAQVSGLWRVDGTISNHPLSTLGGALFQACVSGSPNSGAHRLFIYRNTNTPGGLRVFAQTTNITNTAFAPAQEIYHTGNAVGTVSQSGGIPTGALVQYGSNPNGQFWKYAGGMMICTHSITMSTNVSTATGSIFTNTPETWTYSAVFAENPVFIPQVNALLADSWAGFGSSAASTTTASFRAFRAVSVATAPLVRLFAIGRWY